MFSVDTLMAPRFDAEAPDIYMAAVPAQFM
jgi:hypothetical protein